MAFKRLRSVRLPYARQGLIRFTCLSYADVDKATQAKIDSLIERVGGEYADALRDMMCTTKSATSISMSRHVSETTLYRLRRAFYHAW